MDDFKMDEDNDEFDNEFDNEFDDNDADWDDEDEDINNDDAIQSGKSAAVFEKNIPSITKKCIESNVDEINMLPVFAATPDLKSRSRIGAMIGIRVANLTNITAEQLAVWGLTPEYPFIALKFEFGPFYLNEAKLPKVEVGMVEKLSFDSKLYPFRLSWTISERTANKMLTNKCWPPNGIDMQQIPNAADINDLMESSAKEYAICLAALNKFNGDEQQALEALLDESEVKKLENTLPSVLSCNDKFREIMGKISTKTMNNNSKKQKKSLSQYKKADDIDKITQLKEMFSMDFESAALAFKNLGYEKAAEDLLNPDIKANFVNEANSNNDTNSVSSFFGKIFNKNIEKEDSKEEQMDTLPDFLSMSMIRNTSSGGKVQIVQPEHFFRTIVTMQKHNFLLRCACFALKVLLNGNKFCMICDKELSFAGLKPTICSERFCQWRHDQIGLGFSLSSEILNRPDIVDLLISMTYSAANAGRIQFFFPHGVRGSDDKENESFLLDPDGSGPAKAEVLNKIFDATKFSNSEPGQPKADVAKIKTVIDLCPEIASLLPAAKEGDVYLKKELTKIHCLLYPLLIWIITSNRCHLRLLPPSQRIKEIDTEYQFALCANTPDKECEFQALKTSNGSFLAWHGSPMGNWHSILRMGLRNYSKTKHQSNGAAYGNGIYFGKNFSLSWGYCRPGSNPGWKKSRFGTQMSCMALCEICYHSGDSHHHKHKQSDNTKKPTYSSGFGSRTTDKTNRWVKTSGIYVVEDEKCVTTRFFLIFPKTSGYKSLDADSLQGLLPNVVKKFK